MAEKVIRLYTVRDDVMLDAADTFHALYTVDESDFQSYNIVMFPITFKTDFLTEINDARAVEKDMVVIDEQVEETEEVKGKHKECAAYFQDMKPVIEATFPNNKAVWNQFGYNDYQAAVHSQGRMIQFMEMLHLTTEKYKIELIAQGFTQPQIDMISQLKDELRQEQVEQEAAKKERPVKTQERILILNKPWISMQKINAASKAVYRDNYAKLNEYELPRHSEAHETPAEGPVGGGLTAHVLSMNFEPDTQLKLESTGTTDLMYCITTDEVTSCPAGVQVNAGESVTVSASDLGDPANMYLNVTNLSPDTEGSYSVTIV